MHLFVCLLDLFQWFHVLVSVTHFLVTVNSSFNFLIYFGACQRKCPCTSRRRQQGKLMKVSQRSLTSQSPLTSKWNTIWFSQGRMKGGPRSQERQLSFPVSDKQMSSPLCGLVSTFWRLILSIFNGIERPSQKLCSLLAHYIVLQRINELAHSWFILSR